MWQTIFFRARFSFSFLLCVVDKKTNKKKWWKHSFSWPSSPSPSTPSPSPTTILRMFWQERTVLWNFLLLGVGIVREWSLIGILWWGSMRVRSRLLLLRLIVLRKVCWIFLFYFILFFFFFIFFILFFFF